MIRTGAAAGSLLPPQAWRAVEARLLKAMHAKGVRRPQLAEEERLAALSGLTDDIRDLEVLTGDSYADWLGGVGPRGLHPAADASAAARALSCSTSSSWVRRSLPPLSAAASK